MNINDMTCPSCKGRRFKELAPNTFECQYCGAIVKEEPSPEPQTQPVVQQPPQQQAPVRVAVNINKDADDVSSSMKKGFGQAFGQSLGQSAGGCAGCLIFFLIGVCVLFLIAYGSSH